MGYLTTFTIHNDGIHLILKDCDEFCRNLYDTAVAGKVADFGHGCFGNLVKVQHTRHADDSTLYVHMGNTVMEMNALSPNTMSTMRRNPEFFRDMLNYTQNEARDLKRRFAEETERVKAEKRANR
jgi:hypothetical protein